MFDFVSQILNNLIPKFLPLFPSNWSKKPGIWHPIEDVPQTFALRSQEQALGEPHQSKQNKVKQGRGYLNDNFKVWFCG